MGVDEICLNLLVSALLYQKQITMDDEWVNNEVTKIIEENMPQTHDNEINLM